MAATADHVPFGPELVASVAAVVEAEAAASEEARTMTPAIVGAMWDSGLMRHLNPAAAGGTEPSFAEMIETWIAMARLDGSFGWIGIANLPSSAAAAAYLPEAGFDEVFAANDGRVTMGGQFFPNGTGAATEGGYRLTGSWNFGSGTGHSEYVAAGFMPLVDGDLVMDRRGRARAPGRDPAPRGGDLHRRLARAGPQGHRLVRLQRHGPLRPRRGAPSRSSPASRSVARRPRSGWGSSRSPRRATPSWALGVAASMLDDVQELAVTKTRMGEPSSLVHKPSFQRGLAHHLAMWRAARLLVLDAFATAEAHVAAGEPLTATHRADLRVAAVYATDCCRAIAEWAHLAAGTTAIREGSRLERAFRDMYTGTQHAFISEKVAMDAAQVWLGIQPDPIGL